MNAKRVFATSPVPEPVNAVTFTSVSVGVFHACGVREDGSPSCWVYNETHGNNHGQAMPPKDGPFVSVTAGFTHSCAIRDDGSVVCWGGNEFSSFPPPEGSFTTVSTGGSQACGVERDGSVTCWGSEYESA